MITLRQEFKEADKVVERKLFGPRLRGDAYMLQALFYFIAGIEVFQCACKHFTPLAKGCACQTEEIFDR